MPVYLHMLDSEARRPNTTAVNSLTFHPTMILTDIDRTLLRSRKVQIMVSSDSNQ